MFPALSAQVRVGVVAERLSTVARTTIHSPTVAVAEVVMTTVVPDVLIAPVPRTRPKAMATQGLPVRRSAR